MLDPRPGIATAITVCTIAYDRGDLVRTRSVYPWGMTEHINGGSRCPEHDDPTAIRGPFGQCLETYRLAPTPHARRGLLARLVGGRR